MQFFRDISWFIIILWLRLDCSRYIVFALFNGRIAFNVLDSPFKWYYWDIPTMKYKHSQKFECGLNDRSHDEVYGHTNCRTVGCCLNILPSCRYNVFSEMHCIIVLRHSGLLYFSTVRIPIAWCLYHMSSDNLWTSNYAFTALPQPNAC